jgi:PTH1 family peptidyl-tRNA hydrolase
MKLIVGLGNPGRRYHSTPHSVGWEVADEVAARHGLKWTQARRIDAEFTDGDIRGADAMLLKPTTFMNASGEAVAPLVRGEGLDISRDLLVVVDDANLALGRLRLRERGSAGGHRGLESIAAHLGSEGFPRLRCGVAPPDGEPGEDLAAYVLAKWPRALRPEVEGMIARAADAIEQWLETGDFAAVMSEYNARL